MIIGDLETNGLLDTLDRIHCGVFYNTDTEEFTVFTPDNIGELIEFLDSCKELSCHNGQNFDLKVLKKLYNYEYKGVYRDTLLLSRMLWPDIEAAKYLDANGKQKTVKGPHSVEAWGVRFGIAKPEHEDWSQYSPEMLHRCKEDVKIQAKLWEKTQEYMTEMKEKDPRVDFDQAIRMEHKVWEIIERQSDYGWEFDIKKALDCCDELEGMIEEIDKVLLPSLPMQVIQPAKAPTKAFKADGKITAIAEKWLDGARGELMGDFSKVEFRQMNLGSADQVKDYLFTFGWIPRQWNFKKDRYNKPVRDTFGNPIRTSPKLPDTDEEWDEVVEITGNKNIQMLAERSKAAKRLSSIRGYINNTRDDQRIEARANTCSTNCVIAGTLIQTDTGLIPIEKIQKGDLILTHEGRYEICEDFICNGVKPVYRITTCGRELTCTENHPFWTGLHFVPMNELKIGNWVSTYSDPVEWRKYPKGDYFISNTGFIQNQKGYLLGSEGLSAERRRKLHLRGTVDISVNGKIMKKSIGSIVLETFVGDRPEGRECCHRDGNRTNNHIQNLYWGTSKENTADQICHGRILKAKRESKYTILNQEQVDIIRYEYENNKYRGRYTDLGKRFGVKPETVRAICKRERWQRRTETMTYRYKVPYNCEQIENIEYIGELPTFDITVKNDHSYVANGFVTHNTTRMTHSVVVNVPKAEESVFYGKEMRSLFKASEGKVLVGVDASALEARCEAHYIYPFDKESSRELIEGDIHSRNAAIFKVHRSKAKNGKYCLVYGGSAGKLAQTLGKPKSMAQELYDSYWNGNPGLKKLKQLVEAAHKRYGYLLAIDGRPLHIRYKHAMINTLFQSCGSIIMKVALCIAEDKLKKGGFDYEFVGNFHDEFQTETVPEQAEEIGIIQVQSIREAGEYLKLNVPLDAEYKIGLNWCDTH